MWSCVILLRLLCEMMFQPESLNADKNHQLLLYTIQSVCAPLLIHFKYTHLSKHAPFMCQSASASYLLVHTALRYAAPLPHYHSVITAATGGLLAKKKPHFLAVSANRHHLLCCCSISSPCYLLLPKPQLTKPSRADVRVLRCACQ